MSFTQTSLQYDYYKRMVKGGNVYDLLTYELSKDYNEEFARFKKIRNNM